MVSAKTGSSESFNCSASGFPLPSIRWMRSYGSNENVIAADNVKYQVISTFGSSRLTIKNISVSDEGYYVCNASNNYEYTLDRFYLGVICKFLWNFSLVKLMRFFSGLFDGSDPTFRQGRGTVRPNRKYDGNGVSE